MSRWQEQFETHPIHATLRGLREFIPVDAELKDGTEFAERRRFLKVLDTFEDVLEKIDPEIVPFDQLDGSYNALKHPSLWNQAEVYHAGRDVAHLSAANDQLGKQFAPLALMVSMAGSIDAKKSLSNIEHLADEIFEHFVNRRREGEEQAKQILSSISSQDQSISELSTLIETRKNETNALTSDWQQQFSEAQENRNRDFDSIRQSADSTMEEIKNQFLAAQESRKTNFETWQTEIKNEAVLITQGLTQKTEEELASTLLDADEKHKAILELYELTAGDSVAAGYLKSAEDEKVAADTWRRMSLGFTAATTLWLFSAIYFDVAVSEAGVLLWSKLLMTATLSGVLMWGGAYSAQQSTKHRNNEKRTRWFALEVKAIDPFISSLEDSQQNELKKQLSERLFGQSGNNLLEDDGKVIDEHALNAVVGAITKILSKIPK